MVNSNCEAELNDDEIVPKSLGFRVREKGKTLMNNNMQYAVCSSSKTKN